MHRFIAWIWIISTFLIASDQWGMANALAAPVDNGVAAEPEVQCSSDAMIVNFNTQNPFEGHLYVKGHYDETGCRTDASNNRTASIRVSFNGCGVRRQRSTNPPGLYVSAVIVITFHPMFITKVDRAYNVKCFYMAADKAVTAGLDVSELTTAAITQNVPMPVCKYEVLTDSTNGQPVRYAIVGQPVYHRWSCEGEQVNIFCATVHSCVVDDGQNKRVQLLDENGCAQDKYLMNNLNYTSDLAGGIESHVFKYADKPSLFFQCQIRLTLKDGEQCKRTSDSCSSPTRGKRDADHRHITITSSEDDPEKLKKKGENVDVFSENINILEVDDDPTAKQEWKRVQNLRRRSNASVDVNRDEHDERICLSSAGFGILVAVLVVILLVSLMATSVFCLRTTRMKTQASITPLSS